ncbi:unnamed protein product [Owenia fusiformis]|uniref:Uncharacterized protein n=1 Tax=Owenia fusiformis TaxID=6347 RepID=A0A8J1XKZ4_OWEFU|nr:unnamed protein product [Owenia fusiformis]
MSHLMVELVTTYSHLSNLLFSFSECSKAVQKDVAFPDSSPQQDDKILFFCGICHKAYHHKRTLKEHMRIHTGEKLHQCEFCLKKIIKRSGYIRHVKTHTRKKPNPK